MVDEWHTAPSGHVSREKDDWYCFRFGFFCVCSREFYPTGGFLGNFSDESVMSTAMLVEWVTCGMSRPFDVRWILIGSQCWLTNQQSGRNSNNTVRTCLFIKDVVWTIVLVFGVDVLPVKHKHTPLSDTQTESSHNDLNHYNTFLYPGHSTFVHKHHPALSQTQTQNATL